MKRTTLLTLACATLLGRVGAAEPPPDVFADGEAIELKALPANERGTLCLTLGEEGQVFGGTTGRAAHLFVYDPATGEARSLARLDGGVGFAHGLILLPDGSLLGGTQADPTGTAVKTDPKAVGHLYRFALAGKKPARVEDLGVPVPGQGVYALAYDKATGQVVGNTWPDGHFFSYDLKAKKAKDHGAIAGHRTFETPRHADDVSRGTEKKVSYPRQVSRAIAVDGAGAAYTGGANGFLYRYDFAARKLEKLSARLPAARGREPWASLDAAVLLDKEGGKKGADNVIVGGTSDGYLFELRADKRGPAVRSWGKPLAQGAVQALVATGGAGARTVYGVGGGSEGMPRSFALGYGAALTGITPGGIPRVDGRVSMTGFGAVIADGKGALYAGERDRIARLVRYPLRPAAKPKRPRRPAPAVNPDPAPAAAPAKLPCRVVFAPEGTTTGGSGYTALEVGKDGKVYVGSARYGDYAWLLRFDPADRPLFMEKVVNVQRLTGERLRGINTQGKIHAKIVVGADGRVWFATKQAHEVFDTRPEYGEDAAGYPGGHLCYFDPKTGVSRSVGILKKQEGLMGGALDAGRGRLYYRSEPKDHFLVYDLKTGGVQDRGHLGANGRYMAIDKGGAVYMPGRGAALTRYDPATGYVEDLAVKVKGEGTYATPYVLALGPNGKLYGAVGGHPWLMEFDVAGSKKGPFPEVTMRNVARAAPGGMAVLNLHAGAFGKDGRFYYPLNTSGPVEKGGKGVPHLRVMRFDPKTGKVETVGVPDVSSVDEGKVKHTYVRGDKYALRHMQGAAVGADGSLYLMAIYPQLNVACFPKLTAPR